MRKLENNRLITPLLLAGAITGAFAAVPNAAKQRSNEILKASRETMEGLHAMEVEANSTVIARDNERLSADATNKQLSSLHNTLTNLPDWHKEMIREVTGFDPFIMPDKESFIKNLCVPENCPQGMSAVTPQSTGYSKIAGLEINFIPKQLASNLMKLCSKITTQPGNKAEILKALQQMPDSNQKKLLSEIIENWNDTENFDLLSRANQSGVSARELFELREYARSLQSIFCMKSSAKEALLKLPDSPEKELLSKIVDSSEDDYINIIDAAQSIFKLDLESLDKLRNFSRENLPIIGQQYFEVESL
ncbi:MAG: hypothetical protein LW817_07055 [Candidatus Caenarcaniphilales bacterium]|jgi:hypothetical protein|nr:hypothetical protein [Candidatus Caenarcaniphilales bacterium]